MLAVSECCVSASRRAGRAGEQDRGRAGVDDEAQQDSRERKEKHRIPSKLACVTQSHHVIPSKKKGCAYVLLMKGVSCVHLDPILYSTVLIDCNTT